MPNEKGEGFVDYVLWGNDGKPLGPVEAKRTKRDPRVGQQQARLYADCLEARFGQRPVIFYSNGYERWIWDDLNYPPRSVQGFYAKDELERLIQRRSTRVPLCSAEINERLLKGIISIAPSAVSAKRLRQVMNARHWSLWRQGQERRELSPFVT